MTATRLKQAETGQRKIGKVSGTTNTWFSKTMLQPRTLHLLQQLVFIVDEVNRFTSI